MDYLAGNVQLVIAIFEIQKKSYLINFHKKDQLSRILLCLID